MRKQRPHLAARQHHWNARRTRRPQRRIEPAQFALEKLLIQKQQRAQCLILGRSRNVPIYRQIAEKFGNLLFAQFCGMPFAVEFRNIWFVGGGVLSAECLRLGLADEVRYSLVPILIGDGIQFFEKLNSDIALHLTEVKAYKSGIVALRYEVRK
ncbi:MAG: hypothetical protein C4294_18080 [Nitrospiraceae bacterium]